MIEDPKPKTFEIPMMPIFGVDLGRELGALDSRLARVEVDIQKLDAKIDAVEIKLTEKIDAVDGRVDKCLAAIIRMDERIKSQGGDIKSIRALGAAILAAVIAGIVIHFFFK